MPVPVWTYTTNYPIKRTRKVDRVRVDLGAGYAKSRINASTHLRADGCGTIAAYKGQNIFEITIQKKNYAGNTQFKTILAFLQARVDAGDEAFYWYNPEEEPTAANWDGTHTTGRYKVTCLTDIQDILTHAYKHDFANLIFEETFL